MANDAHVSAVGTVIAEPKNRQVGQTTVVNIKLAVTTTKKQEGSQYPASDVYEVNVWGKPGEYLIDKVKVKTRLWVTGNMMMGEPWTDRQGATHISPVVQADAVKILSGGNYNSGTTQQAQTETEEAPF